MIKESDFVGQSFKQKCGQFLKVLEKTNLKQSGRNPLYKCQFENGEIKFCRKDHVLRGTVQNTEISREHEEEFLYKEWKQNSGCIIIPIRKTNKKISGVYLYEGYVKDYENEGTITFLKGNAQKGRVDNPFLIWKVKEKFEKYLETLKNPTIYDISKGLNLSVSRVGQLLYKYNLTDKVIYNSINSNEEEELRNFIEKNFPNLKIKKEALNNSQEIDI